MRQEDFQGLAANLDALTPHQRKLLVKQLSKVDSAQEVNTLMGWRRYLDRSNRLTSPAAFLSASLGIKSNQHLAMT